MIGWGGVLHPPFSVGMLHIQGVGLAWGGVGISVNWGVWGWGGCVCFGLGGGGGGCFFVKNKFLLMNVFFNAPASHTLLSILYRFLLKQNGGLVFPPNTKKFI